MEVEEWVLAEDIDVIVTSRGGHLELLVARVSGPGAYLLRINWAGKISVNGEPCDLGDDFPAYLGIFDAMSESSREPVVGYCLRLPATDR
jgi:hypothetical protein